MTALTGDRNTPERSGELVVLLVAAATTIHAGSLVVLNGGYAEPGSTATGLIAVGRAEEQVDKPVGAMAFAPLMLGGIVLGGAVFHA